MATQMVFLSEILQLIQQKNGVTLYQPNLTTTRGRPKSIMQQLAEDGLARQDGRRWLVSLNAVDRLLDLTTGGRPGPAPGAQVTLDSHQIRAFAEAVVAAPSLSIQDALAVATGWDPETIGRVERVVIPVSPRRVSSRNK